MHVGEEKQHRLHPCHLCLSSVCVLCVCVCVCPKMFGSVRGGGFGGGGEGVAVNPLFATRWGFSGEQRARGESHSNWADRRGLPADYKKLVWYNDIIGKILWAISVFSIFYLRHSFFIDICLNKYLYFLKQNRALIVQRLKGQSYLSPFTSDRSQMCINHFNPMF